MKAPEHPTTEDMNRLIAYLQAMRDGKLDMQGSLAGAGLLSRVSDWVMAGLPGYDLGTWKRAEVQP